MAGITDRLRIVIHHLAKSFYAGSQAQQLEARRNVRQRLCFSALVGIAVDVVSLFVALLSSVESAP
jgi:hypothetical protein